jgi:hypothetical protein
MECVISKAYICDSTLTLNQTLLLPGSNKVLFVQKFVVPIQKPDRFSIMNAYVSI